ncbi:MAG: hypothetical protein GF320_09345 [Armatimonadia bacterium]|nr:hypothetical protein [Armatimonadia bacterium]
MAGLRCAALVALLAVAAYPSAADPVPVDGYNGDLWFSAELAETRTVPFQPILLRLTVTNLTQDTVEVTHPFIGGGWPLTLEWRERGDETWNAAQHAAGHAPWWEAALQAAPEWIRRQEEIGDFERLAWARYQLSLEELTLERARGLYVDGD